jgi:hypothetical protein
MLASEILRRIIPTLTDTKIRPFPGAADVIVGGTVDAADIAAATFDGQLLVQPYRTALIDFAAGTSTTTMIPAMPGYVGVAFNARLIMKTGGATVPPVGRAGNATISAGNDNVIASASFPAAFTFTTTPAQYNLAARGSQPVVDLTNPIVVEITTAATGGAMSGIIIGVAFILLAP